tara:strand:+ start:1396 stop:1692 length:297 start_codon:yes stop_codon:yes gene_type:complete
MAIVKTTEEDKIEVIGESKDIQIRTATVLKEDGVEIARTFHRHTVECVTSSHDGSSWTHADTDISGESAEVQGIANAVWSTTAKNAKKAANEKTQILG